MGAWGVGITSNDAAQDLKKEFQAAFSYYDVETALVKIDAYVRADGYDESDESDWCDYYYSLANFMWKKGILTDKVRDMAVHMIDTGFGLEIWADEGEKTLNKRKKALAEFREMLLSPQPAKKKIKVDLFLNSVFDVGDYVAFQLQTKDKSYLAKESSFDEETFRSMDGKYVVIRKVQDHISYRSRMVPEVADHWIVYQLYSEFFDEIPDMSQLKNDNWAYKEGRIAYDDPPDKKSYYFYCESALFYFKKRGYKVIGNNKKGIDENINANRMAHHNTLGISSCHYNGDTYMIDSILKTKASKKPKRLFPFKLW
ncbi:MAG: hypothetical protein J6S28_01870 [Clostridia bacterium]|nr:hypothetical protein [Clostridia bacterium]